MKPICITHARLHNLKDLSLEIPRGQLVAITGVSGSGKSTLAFDLVYELGRRRYLQSIGMFSDLAEDSGCERISGLGPTVAVQQGIIRQSNPRSSVGTRSGIFTLLCLLYASEGQSLCPTCGAQRTISRPCPGCGGAPLGLKSGSFSYNSPLGMCLRCQGHGTLFDLDMQRLLPERDTTLRRMLENAGSLTTFQYLLKGLFKEYADQPFAHAPETVRHHVLYGAALGDGRVSHNLFDHLRWKYLKGRAVNGCLTFGACPDCQGERIGPEARRVTLAGHTIDRLGHFDLTALEQFFRQMPFSGVSRGLVDDLLRRLGTLRHNGLGHLSLYRSLPSLSGGELQRLFLATHIDSQLDSLIYVLDEPSVGLHEMEKERLLAEMRRLRDQGNTILLVEHDPRLIAAADHIIDLGPLAGSAGGEVVYQGDARGLPAAPHSITGRYLSGRAGTPARQKIAILPGAAQLKLSGVCTNNLRGVDVGIPLGALVGVAGVSGSGKSSLVIKTLAPLLERCFNHPATAERAGEPEEEPPEEPAAPFSGRLEGAQQLCGVHIVSQQPIGRHDNSNPATYLKLWDPIRKLFAATPQARARGLDAGDFSFNARGACQACSGSGKQRLWLGGAYFVSRLCPACLGRRFQPEVLEVQWSGKTILEVLALTVDEACAFFAGQGKISRVLDVLARCGMGYLRLGQPAPTLSGGEAQRVKLADQISRGGKGHTLYILDEPTIGLSPYDAARLLQLLDALVRQGHSVLVIEHDPALLSACDWIIELGPGGGGEGGRVIAQGDPAMLHANPCSVTGPYLHG